jgi:DNA-binding transcriptional MocR family regulator
MDWLPTINDRAGPTYQRILDALTDDIAAGRVRRGQQLPTHRALAKALGIDVTTVTRAYREAQSRGLTEARVGQGTFIADTARTTAGGTMPARGPAHLDFDLSMNLPPHPPEADLDGRIARGIAALEREHGFGPYLNYAESGGGLQDRGVVADWLRPRIAGTDAERLAICPGAQSALTSSLLALTAPGDVMLTDRLTYPGIKAAAAYARVRLIGVAMDANGMVPDALRIAIRRHAPKMLYLVPTIQNPTTTTMPHARRAEIAEIVTAHDLTLIEDDAYGLLAPEHVPFAALIPMRTVYAASLSKCISPGLRIAFLAAPDASTNARITAALRAMLQMPVPLMAALIARWLADGSADAMIAAIRDEAAARQKMAARALTGFAFAAHRNGHHMWLEVPPAWNIAEFAQHARARGLAVVTSDAFHVADGTEAPPHAVRLALGAARNRAELSHALDRLAVALRLPPPTAQVV